MSLLETMSYGLVPVVTDVGSIGEYVDDGANGLLIGIKDTLAIVRAVKRLQNDEKLMKRLSMAASETIKKRLKPEKYIERLNRLYSVIDIYGDIYSTIGWQI